MQKSHLGGGILHVGAVRLELEVGTATDVTAPIGIGEQVLLRLVEVRVEDLLGEGEAARAENTANFGVFVVEGLVGRREGWSSRELAGRRGNAAELKSTL